MKRLICTLVAIIVSSCGTDDSLRCYDEQTNLFVEEAPSCAEWCEVAYEWAVLCSSVPVPQMEVCDCVEMIRISGCRENLCSEQVQWIRVIGILEALQDGPRDVWCGVDSEYVAALYPTVDSCE